MENKTTEVFGANVERLPLKDLIKELDRVDRNGNCDRPRGDHHSSDAGQQFRIYADLADHTDCFMGITFMMVTNRLAIVTGMPTIHAIRKYYGPVAAGFVGICVGLWHVLFFYEWGTSQEPAPV